MVVVVVELYGRHGHHDGETYIFFFAESICFSELRTDANGGQDAD